MNPPIPISLDTLKGAFSIAESRLRGQDNRLISAVITREDRPVDYERPINELFRSALSIVAPECQVSREKFDRIDISIVQDGFVVGAIESKAMVANAHSRDGMRDSLDVHGIRTKLYRDKRADNSVEDDIANIKGKLPVDTGAHWEIVVPIIYALYRGGAENEWTKEKKPWATPLEYKTLRHTLRDELIRWFQSKYPEQFSIIHATDPILFLGANELWLEQSKKYPEYRSLDAYVSFFAFGRSVGGADAVR